MTSFQNGNNSIITTLKIIVGCLFIFTSIQKILIYSQFVSVIMNSVAVNKYMALWIALTVVLSELLGGVALIFNIHVRDVSLLLIVLLCMFIVVMVYNISQNNIIDCICFGKSIAGTMSWQSVVRNIFLISLLIWIRNTPTVIRNSQEVIP